MRKISAVVITLNEESRIGRCIDSLNRVADEIIVVDSFSSDRTVIICEEKKVRTFQRKFTGYIDQKNFAIGLASHELILSLDADEYLSAELTESILKVKSNSGGSAFMMSRCSSYAGKWIRHGSWYPDTKVRLWEKSYGAFGGKIPHEVIQLEPGLESVLLKGDLMHESYRNIGELIRKVDLYSRMFAENLPMRVKVNMFSALTHGIAAFIKSYLFKLGFLDGYPGLAVAAGCAAHAYFKYARAYELRKFKV